MRIYDRKAGQYAEEDQFQQGMLQFLYGNPLGRFLLWAIVARPWVSKIGAWRMNQKSSVKRIAPFIEQYHIDLSACEKQKFDSFNDFFTRKRWNSTDAAEDELVACADSRLSVYPIEMDTRLKIKQSTYTIADILESESLAEKYGGGLCLVFRLAVEDYHRYVCCDSGRLGESRFIPGMLHTVRSISDSYNVYTRNAREWTVLHTDHFGDVIQIEVGALMVGKIRNHRAAEQFSRLEEKGYFEYGGSTVVLLFEKDRVQLDEDILRITEGGTEVRVRLGEKIGSCIG